MAHATVRTCKHVLYIQRALHAAYDYLQCTHRQHGTMQMSLGDAACIALHWRQQLRLVLHMHGGLCADCHQDLAGMSVEANATMFTLAEILMPIELNCICGPLNNAKSKNNSTE